VTATTYAVLSEADHSAELRKAVIASAALMPDYTGRDISMEYDA
jgi:hypothetical protein